VTRKDKFGRVVDDGQKTFGGGVLIATDSAGCIANGYCLGQQGEVGGWMLGSGCRLQAGLQHGGDETLTGGRCSALSPLRPLWSASPNCNKATSMSLCSPLLGSELGPLYCPTCPLVPLLCHCMAVPVYNHHYYCPVSGPATAGRQAIPRRQPPRQRPAQTCTVYCPSPLHKSQPGN
jgi:hypothetical protein